MFCEEAMLKIYGSMLCPDCVACCKALDAAGIGYTFFDFADDLRNLKEFLKLRDTWDAFEDARLQGYIGIPCIVDEEGKVSLDWLCYVSQDKA